MVGFRFIDCDAVSIINCNIKGALAHLMPHSRISLGKIGGNNLRTTLLASFLLFLFNLATPVFAQIASPGESIGANPGIALPGDGTGATPGIDRLTLVFFSVSILFVSAISYIKSRSYLNFACEILIQHYKFTNEQSYSENDRERRLVHVKSMSKSGSSLLYIVVTIFSFTWITSISVLYWDHYLIDQYGLVQYILLYPEFVAPLLFLCSFVVAVSSAFNFVFASLLAGEVPESNLKNRQAAGFGVIISMLAMAGSISSIIGLVWAALS